jgi:hypothetical protein
MSPVAWVQYQISLMLLRQSSVIRRKVRTVGEISDFFDWQVEHFGRTGNSRSRKDLWGLMSTRMRETRGQWHVMEFGVAYGYATQWWLRHHDETLIAKWEGFDTFKGLPRSWRGLPQGVFNADGVTPEIEDPRVVWRVGLVEDVIPAVDPTEFREAAHRLIYFDFDIYEPSKIAWDWISLHLAPGDILYFDEAVDFDERKLLNESVLPIGNFDLIDATGSQVVIQLRSLNC